MIRTPLTRSPRTPDRSTTPSSRPGRLARTALVGGLAATAALGAITPAGAVQSRPGQDQVAEDEITEVDLDGSAEIASAVAAPSIGFLAIEAEGWIVTPVDTYGIELTMSCTGFVVGAEGHIGSAGHCVDTSPGSSIDRSFREAAVDAMLADGVTCGGITCTEDELAAASVEFSVEGPVAGSAPELTVTTYFGEMVQGAPARVIGYRGIDDGDVALLKIEADDLPVLAVDESTPSVGSDLVSIGFPAVTAELTTVPVAEFKDGRITSLATQEQGAVPLVGVSSPLDHGMSGGPSVGHDGQVVGVISMGYGEHDYLAPASLLLELMAEHGVDNELTDTDVAYRAAFAAYENGDVAEAADLFAQVVVDRPGHAEAKRWQDRTEAEAEAAGPSGDEGEKTPSGESGATPTASEAAISMTDSDRSDESSGLRVILGGALVCALAVVAGLGTLLVRSFRSPAPAAPAATPAYGSGYQMPAYQTPGYQTPAYQTPAYQTPAYQATGFSGGGQRY